MASRSLDGRSREHCTAISVLKGDGAPFLVGYGLLHATASPDSPSKHPLKPLRPVEAPPATERSRFQALGPWLEGSCFCAEGF